MIYTNVDMTISNDKSTVNSKVVLYRGDKNVEIRLYMKGNRFVVQQNMYAQLIIVRPSAPSVFSEIAKINNDTVILTVTGDMIDEFKETGEYSFQIRLYDDNQVARVTLPPVQNGIVIKNPIAVENESIVELALVDSAVVYADLSEEITDIFDEDKVYIMTDWKPGDVITAARLNKIEEGLYYVSKNGGGGGGGATAPYISTTLPETVLVNTNDDLSLDIDFNSPNPGRGTLRVFVNNVDTINTKVMMGQTTTIVPHTAFTRGSNQITVYVIDRVGVISNTLTFYVRYGGLELETDFDPETAYDVGANIRFYFTPTALDTSKPLTMYMEIDGAVQEGVSCTSDTRGFFTFPNTLTAGRYSCRAWISDGEKTSTPLEFTYVLLDDTALVITSYEKTLTAEEGTQLSFAYKVYKKNTVLFNTEIYVNDGLYATGSCGLEKSYFVTDQLPEGTHTVKIVAKTPDGAFSDDVSWSVTITPSTYQMLQPIKTGAVFIASAKNKSNTDEDKNSWIGTNQDNEQIPCVMNNFAYNSENGWGNNELTISGQSHVVVPVSPLSNNAKYGFTLDIEFSTKHIGVENAEVLSLWDDTKNCGIKITTDEVIMRSAVGNELRLFFSEDETISAMFEIDRNEKTAKIFLNGVMCKCMPLNDYVASGVSYLEDFSTDSFVYLGGKDTNGWCKIKNLRIYEVCLSTAESLNNFICNITEKQAQRDKVKFQNGEHLPTLTVYGDFSGLGKNDKKPCDAIFTSTDVTKYGESWKLDGKYSMLQYQGTSSMQYPIKNYRLNPRDANGKHKLDPFNHGIGETRFTLKADFASSGHWQNTGLAKWINDHLYNYNVNDQKSMNPKKWFDLQNGGKLTDTRETIDGYICRLILVNDGETPLMEGQEEPEPGNTKDMGVFNFNNDKSNVKTLGFDSKNFPFCASFEVASNSDTSAGAFMAFDPTKHGVVRNYIQVGNNRVSSDINNLLTPGKKITIFSSETINVRVKYGYVTDGNYSTYVKTFTGTHEIPADVTAGYSEAVINVEFPNQTLPVFITINDVTYYIEIADPPAGNIVQKTVADEAAELAYYKESFELRYPDEDDVGPEFGFLGMNGDANKGVRRWINFADKSTDKEFVANFEQYFNKQYTFRYYILVMVLGMVDNLGKNMMLDTWDGEIAYPRFYDMDTICSFDNSGVIKFDTDIEMEQGYWNTSSSRLWTRIRDLFHDELIVLYNDMRKNGLSYESLMSYFYDEQIAMIPEKYYNMDYDVKYGPYADEYANKANGSSYEHLKRWLKRRIMFTDTLFDYAPAYTNDALTIRANTTELMTLEIETYVPVYQHLSWYNNQMDKKKINGKTAVTFTGKAQAETDQEVFIYGGSNIKRIRGLSSMNPDSMLIGNADRLMELECKNATILTDINSNKANLSANRYLTKVDLSGCTALGGTLRLNNSPLIQEINIQGTAIDNLLLSTSLRNLRVLKLPDAIKTLVFENLSVLEVLEVAGSPVIEQLSLTNCPNVDFTIFTALKKINSLYLNNSLVEAEVLTLNDVPNIELINMPKLYSLNLSPNDEYEDITIAEMQTKPNITIKSSSCPNFQKIQVTAPQRVSYMPNDDGVIQPYKVFAANTFDISQTGIRELDLLCTSDIYNLKVPTTLECFICDSAYDLKQSVITDGAFNTIHNDLIKPYTEEFNENVLIKEAVPNKKLECTNFISGQLDGNGIIQESNWLSSEEYIEVMPNTDITNNSTVTYLHTSVAEYDKDKKFIKITKNTNPFTCTLGKDTAYIRLSVESNTDIITYTGCKYRVPNIIPTAANGSIICNMWSNNTNQPTSTSPYIWDLKGLVLEDFFTYGVNNKIDTNVKIVNDKRVKRINDRYYWYQGDGHFCEGLDADPNTKIELTPFKLPLNVGEIKISTNVISAMNNHIVSESVDGYSKRISGNSPLTYTCTDGVVYYLALCAEIVDGLEWIQVEFLNKIYRFYFNDFETIDNQTTHVELRTTYLTNLDELKTTVKGNDFSVTMPKRISDYKVRMINANIKPDRYPTMFYPKFIDTVLPITGKVDYTTYTGESLAWAFAYTTDDVTRLPMPANKMWTINNEYNKLYGTNFVDVTEVWAYKNDDFSNRTENPNITKAYIELTSSNYQTRIDEVLQWYPNCTELHIFDNNDITSLTNFIGSGVDGKPYNNTYASSQIKKVYFMEGYFNKLTNLSWAFRTCKVEEVHNIPNSVIDMSGFASYGTPIKYISNFPTSVEILSQTFKNAHSLVSVPELPSTVKDMYETFYDCNNLNCQFDLTNLVNLDINGLKETWRECTSLTYTPILPSNYSGKLEQTFKGTKITTAPVLPDGITSLSQTFENCKQLTTVGNIPSSCNDFYRAFYCCSKLASAPETGWNGIMHGAFNECTTLNQKIVISSLGEGVRNGNYIFNGCTLLSITPVLPDSYNGQLIQTFAGTALTTPAKIPNNVTNINACYQGCSKITEVTIPLTNLTTYDNALTGCTSLTTINWEGQRNSDFSLITLGAPSYSKPSIINLANEHLATVESATLTLSESCSDYLSVFEIFSLSERGWNVVGAASSGGGFKIVKKEEDTSTLTTDDTITMALIELTQDNYKTRVYQVLKWYPNCNEIGLYDDKSVTSLAGMFNNTDNKNVGPQITKISTLSGYFTNLTNMSSMFSSCKFTSLDLSGFNTRNITNMSQLFKYCGVLASLDLSGFNTSNVTDMADMFSACYALTTLDLSNFNTSKVTTMKSMFEYCSGLTSINLSSFDTSNVTDMSNMFDGCSDLASLDLSNFNTSKVTTMMGMFEYIRSLKTLDLSSFDTSSVTDMRDMFYYCRGLTSVNVSSFDTRNVTNMSQMFENCNKLTTLDLSNFNTSKVTSMQAMFRDCTKLTTVNVSSFDVSKVTELNVMFSGCSSIATLDLSSFITSSAVNMNFMFGDCANLTSLDISNFNTSKVTEMRQMFSSCAKLTSLNLSSFDTSKVKDMSNMFYECTSLTSLDLSNFVTSNVTTMNAMFAYCSSITSLDLTNFNTSSVTDMQSMFSSCGNLTSLNLSSFNTSNITSMYYMFNSCRKLTTLDLSNFNTSKVTSMSNTFRDCSGLTSVNISSFDTSNVTSMRGAFYGCKALVTLDVSNFNTSKVTDMNSMFAYCSGLTSLDLTNFDTNKVTDMGKMFYTVSSLLSLKFHFNFNAEYTNVLQNSDTNLIIDWLGEYVVNINLKLIGKTDFSLTNIRSLLLALGTVESATLNMYTDQLNALSEEEKAGAVSKGWTLQSA